MKKIYVLNWAFFLLGPLWDATDLDGGGTSLNLSMSTMIKKCASVEWEYGAKQNLTCKVKNAQIIEPQVCCWFQFLNWDLQWLEISTGCEWILSRLPLAQLCHVEASNPKSRGLSSWILVLRLRVQETTSTTYIFTLYIEPKDYKLKLKCGNDIICCLHFCKRITFSRFWRPHFPPDFHHVWSPLSQEQWQSNEHCDVGTPELEAQLQCKIRKATVNVIIGHYECMNSLMEFWSFHCLQNQLGWWVPSQSLDRVSSSSRRSISA